MTSALTASPPVDVTARRLDPSYASTNLSVNASSIVPETRGVSGPAMRRAEVSGGEQAVENAAIGSAIKDGTRLNEAVGFKGQDCLAGAAVHVGTPVEWR